MYIVPTRAPKVKPTALVIGVERPCDDEDCFDGSGSDPIVTGEPIFKSDEYNVTELITTTTTTGTRPTVSAPVPAPTAGRPTPRSTTTTTTTVAPATSRAITRPTPPRMREPVYTPTTIRVRPTSTINYDILFEISKKRDREEMERKNEFEGEFFPFCTQVFS